MLVVEGAHIMELVVQVAVEQVEVAQFRILMERQELQTLVVAVVE
jgi:hypothetical protein